MCRAAIVDKLLHVAGLLHLAGQVACVEPVELAREACRPAAQLA